jgi:hypothetical protein
MVAVHLLIAGPPETAPCRLHSRRPLPRCTWSLSCPWTRSSAVPPVATSTSSCAIATRSTKACTHPWCVQTVLRLEYHPRSRCQVQISLSSLSTTDFAPLAGSGGGKLYQGVLHAEAHAVHCGSCPAGGGNRRPYRPDRDQGLSKSVALLRLIATLRLRCLYTASFVTSPYRWSGGRRFFSRP